MNKLINIICICYQLLQVQDVESSDVNTDMFNSLTQDKMALEGRIIHLESVTREREEVHKPMNTLLIFY